MIKKVEDKADLHGLGLRIIGVWDTKLVEGAFIAPHSHQDVEEVYYILEGAGKISIDNKRRKVKKGDLVYVPPKTIHTILHTGQKPLRLVTISVSIKDKSSRRARRYIS